VNCSLLSEADDRHIQCRLSEVFLKEYAANPEKRAAYEVLHGPIDWEDRPIAGRLLDKR
jgi:hypothetical protein